MASREFDVVVFGATGFTGTQVVRQLSELGVVPRWAVAGRRPFALAALVNTWAVPGGHIHADVTDTESLKAMARSAKLVLNATGPYRFFGEAVIRACIEEGTDYIDLCGEPEFMERMLLLYQDAAKEAGVLICHSCAFDSIPADLGIWHCAQRFKEAGGQCGHVELFHSIEAPLGYSGHVTTFEAAVHGVGSAGNLGKVRKQLEARYGRIPRGPAVDPAPRRGGRFFWDARLERYAIPFIGADASVVRSSRRMLTNILKIPGLEDSMPEFGIYFTIKSRWSLFKILFAGFFFQLLAGFALGRALLLRLPSFFTFGAFTKRGPSDEQMRNNKWVGDYFAAGVFGGKRKTLQLRAELRDPGYIGTALLFVTVAQTILAERPQLTAAGGIFTPAALFCRSSLLSRLSERGVAFETVSSDL